MSMWELLYHVNVHSTYLGAQCLLSECVMHSVQTSHDE